MTDDAKKRADRAAELRAEIEGLDHPDDQTAPDSEGGEGANKTSRPGESMNEFIERRMHEEAGDEDHDAAAERPEGKPKADQEDAEHKH